MSVSRRQFIKISGGGLGMAAAASGLVSKGWGFDASQGNDPRTDGDQVIPTFCEMCSGSAACWPTSRMAG